MKNEELKKYWIDHNKNKSKLVDFIRFTLTLEEYYKLDGMLAEDKAQLLIEEWESEKSNKKNLKQRLELFWHNKWKNQDELIKEINKMPIADYLLLDGYTAYDKSKILIEEWQNKRSEKKSFNLALLEESLMHQFRLFSADTGKLGKYISTELSDEAWALLQTKHKGSSEAKAYSLTHMWAKNGTLKWEGMPEVGLDEEAVPPRGMCKITDSHNIDESDVKLASNIIDNTVGAENRSVIKKDGICYGIPTDKEIEEAVSNAILNKTAGEGYADLFTIAEEQARNGLKKVGIDVVNAMEKIEESKHKGLRFNEGKLRYDLVHPWSQEQMVRVLTKGSVKYEERNWERGMKWSNVLASAKRHMAAIERGEDYDIDPNCPECQKSTKDNWVCKNHTGELHAALLQTNAHFLTAYYKIYPQGDDRPKPYLSHKKIGLDIDDVLADFVGAWLERYPQNKPNFWNFDKDFGEKYEAIKNDKDFWMNIKPKIDPSELLFEPTCYITSRGVPSEWTEEWLQRNGFPAVPVYTVGLGESKVEIAKQSGIDIFVDDRFENFVELNNADICTFLMDANHNKRYDVQARRIYSLKDLV